MNHHIIYLRPSGLTALKSMIPGAVVSFCETLFKSLTVPMVEMTWPSSGECRGDILLFSPETGFGYCWVGDHWRVESGRSPIPFLHIEDMAMLLRVWTLSRVMYVEPEAMVFCG